jgi:hypothetical protein
MKGDKIQEEIKAKNKTESGRGRGGRKTSLN